MSKHRRYNWSQLFAEFEQSGLPQIEFCKLHDINPKYFSLKLSKHKNKESGGFIQVEVKPEKPTAHGLTLEVGNCRIHCPATMPIQSFASLVKFLA